MSMIFCKVQWYHWNLYKSMTSGSTSVARRTLLIRLLYAYLRCYAFPVWSYLQFVGSMCDHDTLMYMRCTKLHKDLQLHLRKIWIPYTVWYISSNLFLQLLIDIWYYTGIDVDWFSWLGDDRYLESMARERSVLAGEDLGGGISPSHGTEFYLRIKSVKTEFKAFKRFSKELNSKFTAKNHQNVIHWT